MGCDTLNEPLQIDGYWRYIPIHASLRNVRPFGGIDYETALFRHAIKTLHDQLIEQIKETDRLPKTLNDILTFYTMILEDGYFIHDVETLINESKLTAISALDWYFQTTFSSFQSAFPYFQARTLDFSDLKQRLSAIMVHPSIDPTIEEVHLSQPTIIGMSYPSVSALLSLDLTHVVGIVTPEGSAHSHFAIILKSYQIPYTIASFSEATFRDGTYVRLNLTESILTKIDPGESSQEWRVSNLSEEKQAELRLHPSINRKDELPQIIPSNWQSIGLVRTEFMFMDLATIPDRITQYLDYQEVARRAHPLRVLFRLFDHEPDKPLPGIESKQTGMDFLLSHVPILTAQLDVLIELASHYSIGITLPMVKTLDEINRFTAIYQSILSKKADLSGSSEAIKLGIMVEQQSIIPHLNDLEGIDYVLIGTNDLSADLGYDRMKSMKEEAYTQASLRKLCKDVKDIADQKNWSVIICGDAANDDAILSVYQNDGFSDFAPSPSVLGIRN